MARKVSAAVQEWRDMAEMRGELASEAYDAQDAHTQDVLDRIVARLGGNVNTTEEKPYVEWNLLYVAVEMLKDLAMLDIRVGTFVFPPSLCSSCGAEIVVRKKRGRA